MEGPFARAIGLSRKAILDGITKYTELISALTGERVISARVVPYFAERPRDLPAGNYCISIIKGEKEEALFVLASRLVFTKDDIVIADYRSLVLGDVTGAKRGAEAITIYAPGMDIEHNRRTALVYASDKESSAMLNGNTLFPPDGTLLLI